MARLMFSLTFLTLAVYLLPGLFKHADGEPQKPAGQVFEWVESFLLRDKNFGNTGAPPPKAGQSPSSPGKSGNKVQLVWMRNVDEALERAAKENKPLFFAFTGLT